MAADYRIAESFYQDVGDFFVSRSGVYVSSPPYLIASIAARRDPSGSISLPSGYDGEGLDRVMWLAGAIDRDVRFDARQAAELARIGAQILELDDRGTLDPALTRPERESVAHLVELVARFTVTRPANPFWAGDTVVSVRFDGPGTVTRTGARVFGEPSRLVYVSAGGEDLEPLDASDLRKGSVPIQMAYLHHGRGVLVFQREAGRAEKVYHGRCPMWEFKNDGEPVWARVGALLSDGDAVLSDGGWKRTGDWVYDGSGGWTATVSRS